MTSSAVPPAGWFPDPADAEKVRWWSGQGWTDEVRPKRTPAPAEATPVAPTPVQPTPVASAATAATATTTAAAEPAGGIAMPGSTPHELLDAMLAAADARAAAATPPPPTVAAPPPAPSAAPPAAPAAAPVAAPAGNAFAATVDPAVANRYRTAPAEPAHSPSTTGSTPNQEGWPGMPLPSGFASGSAPSALDHASTGYPAAAASAQYLSAPAPNPIAKTALIAGLVAVGFAIFNTFNGFLALGALVSGTVALVQGIIGLVRAARGASGKGMAIGGIVAAGSAVLIVVVSFFVAVASAISSLSYSADVLEEEIVSQAADWDITLTQVICPESPPLSAGSSFLCSAIGSAGETYTVTVSIDQEGYYSWLLE